MTSQNTYAYSEVWMKSLLDEERDENFRSFQLR